MATMQYSPAVQTIQHTTFPKATEYHTEVKVI